MHSIIALCALMYFLIRCLFSLGILLITSIFCLTRRGSDRFKVCCVCHLFFVGFRTLQLKHGSSLIRRRWQRKMQTFSCRFYYDAKRTICPLFTNCPSTIACQKVTPLSCRTGRYVIKVANDPALFNKHIAWKSGRREDLSDKFWSYWSSQPASGDWK